ncbi:MAG: response regulator, partial [Gammaproteobacteria bacterium]
MADDDSGCLNLIDRFLENEGCDTVLANDGIEAWKYLESEKYCFDVAILDRQMPGLTGIEILHKMKMSDRLKDIPVIFQSGLINLNDIRDGMREGAYYYLTKPYVRRSLISTVEAAISELFRKQRLIHEIKNTVSNNLDISSFNGHVVFKTLDEITNIACTLA